MKYLFSFLPLLFLLTSRSCDKKVEENPSSNLFGQTIEIEYGQRTDIGDGLVATLTSVTDNRCPEEVQCIQAGKAKVSILLEKAEQNGKVDLEVKGLCTDRDGACGNSGVAMGYMVRLLTVDPYPAEGQTTDPSKMSARLVINRGK